MSNRIILVILYGNQSLFLNIQWIDKNELYIHFVWTASLLVFSTNNLRSIRDGISWYIVDFTTL